MLKKNNIRVVFIVCSIVGLSFITLGAYNYTVISKSIIERIETSSIPLLSKNIYSTIKDLFVPALRVGSVMSNDSFLKNWVINSEHTPYEIVEYLETIKNEYGYAVTFFISSKTKNYYYNDGKLKVISKTEEADRWYYDFIESGKKSEVNIDFDASRENMLTFFLNFRVEDSNNNLIGITGIGMDVLDVSEILSNKEGELNRKIYLMDRDGNIKISSSDLQYNKQNILKTDGIKNIAKELLTLSNTPTILKYRVKSNDYIASSVYIKDIDLFLVLEHNATLEMKPALYNLIRTLVFGFLFLVILLVLLANIINFFNNKLENLAIIDPLTKCYNRRGFNKLLNIALSKGKRGSLQFVIIMIDVDDFKNINDQYGHQLGDKVLELISKVFLKRVRPYDTLGRFGGDEFIILLESNLDDAKIIAARIKQDIFKLNVETIYQGNVHVTISMGLHKIINDDTFDSIIESADRALYMAKNAGKNCIKIT